MRKSMDSCFLHYGIRQEDKNIITQACMDSDIDPEWFSENVLRTYQEERSKENYVEDRKLRKILNKALKKI